MGKRKIRRQANNDTQQYVKKIKIEQHETLLKTGMNSVWWINYCGVSVRVMVYNATFNNISAISWQPVLLVKETRVSGENHWPAASHWQTLSL